MANRIEDRWKVKGKKAKQRDQTESAQVRCSVANYGKQGNVDFAVIWNYDEGSMASDACKDCDYKRDWFGDNDETFYKSVKGKSQEIDLQKISQELDMPEKLLYGIREINVEDSGKLTIRARTKNKKTLEQIEKYVDGFKIEDFKERTKKKRFRWF